MILTIQRLGHHGDGVAAGSLYVRLTLSGEIVADESRCIVDLFADCGTFVLPLPRTAKADSVEGDSAILVALDRTWRHGGDLNRITTERRDLFRRPLLAGDLTGYDAVVIDPPRAGAEAQTAEIARAQVPRVAGLSCNPVSFARDARILIDEGYRLDWVEVVDQFRWSPHVELAAKFTLSHMPGRNA